MFRSIVWKQLVMAASTLYFAALAAPTRVYVNFTSMGAMLSAILTLPSSGHPRDGIRGTVSRVILT